MTAFVLHVPERNGSSRWLLAGTATVVAHLAIISSVALWYARAPVVEPQMIPAIAVSLAPVQSSSPEVHDQDLPVGPNTQQAVAVPQEPPKTEEKPADTPVEPPAHADAEVTLPKAEEHKEKPTPQAVVPAPETTAVPTGDRVGQQFTEAASNAYDARVVGHLKRFVRYPMEARGASGTVVVKFELNRAGEVIGSEVKKSSGNRLLDHAAIETLQRASPFPAFPAAKPEGQESYLAPVEFYK